MLLNLYTLGGWRSRCYSLQPTINQIHNIMKKEKQMYASPEAEVLVVQIENTILDGSAKAANANALPSFTQDYGDWN